MSKFGVSSTGEGAAFCRAVEQYLPENERLFNDPIEFKLLSGMYQWMLNSAKMRQYVINQTEKAVKGLYGEQVCRTRYIDEAVTAALGKGIRQVVILGSGMDTRAYRLPGMDQAQVFEVDMPRVVKMKQPRVAKLLGKIPANVHFVPTDFDEQDLGEAMQGCGFDPSQPAIFVWEAVTQYLTAEAVKQTLSYIGKSAKGSRVVFTYVLRWIIEHPERDHEAMGLLKLSKQKMAPFIFGWEPTELPEYLKPFHLRVIEDAGDEYYKKNWLEPMGRKLDVTYGERICLAETY
jgi:methyltransferase (TIGR00027 family)